MAVRDNQGLGDGHRPDAHWVTLCTQAVEFDPADLMMKVMERWHIKKVRVRVAMVAIPMRNDAG